MRTMTILAGLLAMSACKGKSTETSAAGSSAAPTTATKPATPEPGSAAAPAPAVVPNPDGVPDTIRLVAGNKLVTKRESGSTKVWVYAYDKIEPQALAEQQRKTFEEAGWKSLVRKEALDTNPGPVYTTFATRDGTLSVAQAYPQGGATELKLMVEPMHGLVLEAPAGYPAGFPFLPFGVPVPPKKETIKASVVYNGELAGLVTELAAATKAAGWDCLDGSFTKLTLCKKDGVELFVHISSLSSNRQSLIIGQ